MTHPLAGLGQEPPPPRPVNWMQVLGWGAAVGTALWVFNGTVNMKANRRRSSRSSHRNPRRSSHARPKPAKMSELAVWGAVGTVRQHHPREILDVLPPGVAAKFKKLPPGLYKYGTGSKGEAIVRFKNATLKGAMTSTRIGASKVGQYHWLIDNFDPNFPVVIRGIDDHGRSYFRVEEYAKRFEGALVPVARGKAYR